MNHRGIRLREAEELSPEKKAQKERERKYGIGIKPGGHVTKPAEYADVPEDMFADPVNFRYPLSPPSRAINAITRYNDTSNRVAGGYTDAEWARIGQRIAKAVQGKVLRDGKVVDKEQEATIARRGFEAMNGSLDDYISKIRDAFDSQFARLPNGEYKGGCWVTDTYEDHIIARFNDEYYQIPYTIEDGNVIFAGRAEWTKVKRETRYVPVTESVRLVAAKKARGDEPEGREWEVVIIGPETDSDLVIDGEIAYIRSKNGRLYKVSALEESVPLWEGVKVYDNHLTDAELESRQGMRSVVHEWVGVIVSPAWDSARKAVTGVLKVVDDNLRMKLLNAASAGVLDKIGLSIDALGEGKETVVAGSPTSVVERISQALSVDVVADPAAGGRLARMIAGLAPLGNPQRQQTMEVEMDPEELKKLIAEAVSAALGGIEDKIKTIESRLPGEAEEEPEPEKVPETVQKQLEAQQKKLAELEERARISECAHILGVKLAESGLPESYRELIARQFRGRIFKVEELDTAIREHREALTKISESGKIILPDGGRINISPLTEWDRYELAFLRLVAGATRFNELATPDNARYHGFTALQRFIEAGRPALPSVRRLSEWYYQFTEDYDGLGVMRNRRFLEAQGNTTNLASIVKNTVNLLLAADYSVREQWWAPIVRQEDVDTLDQATLVRVYGLSNLSVISEGAAYEEAAWADEEETASYAKRGQYVAITLETFLLDKLNRIRTLPTRLSNAWYNTVSALVSSVFTVNSATGPVLGDGGALFNSTAVTTAGGHANLGTSALTYATFVAARTAMMKQTDQPLGGGRALAMANKPKYLLVPVDLLATAEQIRNSELVPSQSAATSGMELQTINSVRGQFEIVVVPDWTDTNNWAAVADPEVMPAIWLIWLRGRRTPEIFSAEDERAGAMFTNDELRFKVRQFGFRFSSTYDCAPVSDFRPLYKANV